MLLDVLVFQVRLTVCGLDPPSSDEFGVVPQADSKVPRKAMVKSQAPRVRSGSSLIMRCNHPQRYPMVRSAYLLSPARTSLQFLFYKSKREMGSGSQTPGSNSRPRPEWLVISFPA